MGRLRRGKAKRWTISLVAGMALGLSWPRARADEPKYEKSGEFQKSKEDFGQDKPPVSIDLGSEKEKPPAKERKKRETPAWLKGKKVGGWGGPLVNHLQLNMRVFDPLTHERGLDRFDDAMFPVGGFGLARLGNLKIGGMGFGASQDESKRIAGDEREAEVNLGFGGLLLEYEADPHPKVGILVGAMLGGGGISLSAKGDDVTDKEWSVDESFLAAYPYLGVSLKMLSFLRVEASYGWMFFDYSPGGYDYNPGPGVKSVDGSLSGGGSAQVRVVFGFETKTK